MLLLFSPGPPPIGPQGRQFARHHQKIELLAFIINSDELYLLSTPSEEKIEDLCDALRGKEEEQEETGREKGNRKGKEGRKGHRLPKRRRLHSSYIGDERIVENLFSGARCVVI